MSNFIRLTDDELVVNKSAAIRLAAATELLLDIESQIASLESGRAELMTTIYTLTKLLLSTK